ncbi:hypothetical protein HUT18_12650 [Streptomyces sp. NA04227]|uniref:hypothetical protein n=1 Tax=Streptomyces sp. NA04227 TaxID=2742136 RepID=UPI00159119B4|nr:hypothetical protein [Streptomyces sp. NA04227]QKW07122.1 hypothetical protein HUT18_12650 [Streptomyces sp. NA04227]
MEAELAALAASAATSVVSVMVTETWTQVRGRLVRFLNRGGDEREQEALEGEVQLDQEELTAAHASGDEQAAADVEAGWRTRMRRALLADPAAAEELRAILRELDQAQPPRPSVVVNNTVSGGTYHAPVVMAQNVSGGIHQHGGAAPSGPTGPGRAPEDLG